LRDLERFGLREFFDSRALLFSSEVGVWKPDPRIFREAAERLRLSPELALYVGDRLVDDVGGAQRAGLRAVLREHDQPDNDFARGAELGIVPDGRIRALSELPPLVEALDRAGSRRR